MDGTTFFLPFEPVWIKWLQDVLGTAGASVAAFFTLFGEELILVAILGFLYWGYDKKFGIFVGTNLMIALVMNPLLKNIFLRRRPYMDHPGIQCLKAVEPDAPIMDIAQQGYSFPSGHSSSSATVYPSLPLYAKKKWLWIPGILLPLLVGLSRVILGVHYPTDVLAGFLLGALSVLVMTFLQQKIKRKWLLYLILTLLASIGCFYCKSADYFASFGMMIGFFLANLFEEKFVKFENSRRPLVMIFRTLGGIAVFLLLTVLLKLPFSADFLSSGTGAAYFVRACRYGISAFICIGVYPMLFRVRLFRKEKPESRPEGAKEHRTDSI